MVKLNQARVSICWMPGVHKLSLSWIFDWGRYSRIHTCLETKDEILWRRIQWGNSQLCSWIYFQTSDQILYFQVFVWIVQLTFYVLLLFINIAIFLPLLYHRISQGIRHTFYQPIFCPNQQLEVYLLIWDLCMQYLEILAVPQL